MAPESFKVSVPGSMMLLGEHAVLNGKPALVCAVNRRLHMQLVPRADRQVTISDTRLGTLTQDLEQLDIQKPFNFILAASLRFKSKIPGGFDLIINSEFSSVIGLGSSAAVTVATVALLGKWVHGNPLNSAQIFTLAKSIMLEVQGGGSGADLAASVYGGVLGYRAALHSKPHRFVRSPNRFVRSPNRFVRLPIIPNLTAVYCGYKTPTPEVIKIVQAAQQSRPHMYAKIYNNMHNCVKQAITAIKAADWRALGAVFNRHYALQVALGVSDPVLNSLVQQLKARRNIYGAKISGAGLGDCVIGLGVVTKQIVPRNAVLNASSPDQSPAVASSRSSRTKCDAVAGIHSFAVSIEPRGLIYADH